jgi:replicative DNA helicase
MSNLFSLPNASPESEKVVLSCMMQDPANHVGPVLEGVGMALAEAFRGGGHLTICEAILDRHANRQGCDMISVTQHLKDKQLLDAAGGPAAVAEIAMFASTTHLFTEHMNEVQRKAVLMRLVKSCDTIRAQCLSYDDRGNPQDLIGMAESEFLGIRDVYKKQGDNLAHISKCVDESLEQIETMYKNRGKAVQPGCIPTGFKDMDRMLTGFKPDQFIVLGARPAIGKSSLALNIITHAVKEGFNCLFFSMEMSRTQQTNRMICSESGVTLQRIKDGLMSRQDLQRIGQAGARIAEGNLWLETTPAITLHQLRSIARRMKYQGKLDFIVIDYLQLMRCPSRRADGNRALEIGDITGGLKQLAMELHIPIMALAQLNRDADKRSLPKASDLRESGTIEQDADVIILMHRDKEATVEPCTILIEKQRDGATGPLELMFSGENTKFSDKTEEMYTNNSEKYQSGYSGHKKAA